MNGQESFHLAAAKCLGCCGSCPAEEGAFLFRGAVENRLSGMRVRVHPQGSCPPKGLGELPLWTQKVKE